MYKMNASEVMASFNEIVNQANAGKRTAENVAKDLYAKAAELRAMADALTLMARKLSGNTSNEPVGREVIVLKDGERIRKKKPETTKTSKPAKPTKPKYHKPTQAEIDVMTPERRARYEANVARCDKMRMAKALNALQEKAKEAKIS